MEIVVSPILNDDDLDTTANRIEEIWDAKEGTSEYYELDILTLMVAEYERKKYPLKESNPIEMIKFRMEQMQISKADLAKLAFNDHRGRVTEILSGKRKLSLDMIRKLSAVLRVEPEFLIKEY